MAASTLTRAAGVVLDRAGHVAVGLGAGAEAQVGEPTTVIASEDAQVDAEVVGADPRTGVTVVRAVDPTGLVPATLGDSDLVAAADAVIVVEATEPAARRLPAQVRDPGVSVGGLSMIEVDVAPPGGGVVATTDGEVLGLLTASAAGDAPTGYALPVTVVRRIADQLIAGETPTHPYLGVMVDSHPDGGVIVQQVGEDSPADRAGLGPGDVVTALDGRPVGDIHDLVTIVQSAVVGQDLAVTYRRGGAEQEATVTVGAAPR